MKIDEIKEGSDWQLSKLTGKVIEVNQVSQGKNGPFQIIFIEDGTGQMKVKIKDEKLFIDDFDAHEKVIHFTADLTDTVPRGVQYLTKYEMVVVSEGATLGYEQPKKEPEPMPVLTPPVQPVVDYGAIKTMTPGLDDFGKGPFDEIIVEEFHEHLRILKILEMVNIQQGNPFDHDELMRIKTGIKIEASRAKAKILPSGFKAERFAAYEKPYPNPVITPTKVEPVVESAPPAGRKGKKNTPAPEPEPEPAPIVLEDDTEVEVDPVTDPDPEPEGESQSSLPARNQIEDISLELARIRNHRSPLPAYAAMDFKGATTLGDALEDDNRRPKLIAWAYKGQDPAMTITTHKAQVIGNILKIMREMNTEIRFLVVMEAMMADIAAHNGIKFDFSDNTDETYQAVELKLNNIMAELHPEKNTPHALALAYFTSGIEPGSKVM